MKIDNLEAKMRGKKLNFYQQGLALDEYEKLIEEIKELRERIADDVSKLIHNHDEEIWIKVHDDIINCIKNNH